MSEKEKFILSDPSIVPNNKYISSIIGDKSRLWENIMNHVHENYEDISEVWKFYNDGKQWFFRVIQKKKTLFWIGVLKDTFRVTFYFGDKAEPLIEGSSLPESIKNNFKSAKHFGKIRGISIKMTKDRDVEYVLKLTALKSTLK
ncbi:MAG: DUF3788 family protein [Bacteroidales bacterium]|nr:DUF3788 family protein [Bacteroidales bacterium]